jgi:protein-ribulosamine 3-kinase
MSSRKSTVKGTGVSFAAKLAKLHTTPAPIPEGFSEPQFGFPVPNCIGSTCQLNEYTNSWSEFYAENRLKEILKADIEKNGKDSMLTELVERTASTVVPRLLQSGHLGGQKGITPAIVHGDLWYGNHGQGSIDKGGIEEVVFDCCACYAHSEYDLGCMKMFGGFSEATMGEYHNLKPKDEPVEEYDDRVELYELWVGFSTWSRYQHS